MLVCNEHWDILKASLERHGLQKFMQYQRNKIRSMSEYVLTTKKDSANLPYDPMLYANILTFQFYVTHYKVPLVQIKDKCPVCETRKHNQDQQFLNQAICQLTNEARVALKCDNITIH